MAPQSRGQQGRAYDQEELQALLRGALRELMADGTPFRDLSVERLVSTAGVARSTFYSHFEDKAAMLRALSAQTLLRLFDGVRSWVQEGPGATREEIAAGMRLIIDVFAQEEAVMRAVQEASAYDASIRDAYAGSVEDYARVLARFIRSGRRAGLVRDVRPAEAAAALAWMTERTVSRLGASTSRARRNATAEALADVIWRALFP
jgi:AcrR family transcriptional regulator